MNTPPFIIIAIYFLFSLLRAPCFSQGIDTTTFKERLSLSLEELLVIKIITASKIQRSSIDLTQQFDVISENEFNKIISEKGNLAELIQYFPGSSVKVLSRNDANWGAYGGIGAKYNTYMAQGLPMDAFIDPQSLNSMAIQHIEIQRGPASILYPNFLSQDFAGNQSPLAGTINLILKEIVKEPKTLLSLGIGSNQTYEARAYNENRSGPAHIISGVSYEQSDYTDYGTSNSWLNIIDNPEYKKMKLFLGSTFIMNASGQHKISLFGNQTLHSGTWGRPNRQFDFQYTLINAGYTGELNDKLTLSMKTGLRRYIRDYEDDNYSTVGDLSLLNTSGVEQTIIPIDFSLTINHFNNSNFTTGTDFQNANYHTWDKAANQLHTVTGNDAIVQHMGVYAQEELQVKKFVIRAGGRYNYIRYNIDRIGGAPPASNEKSWNVFLWSTGTKFRLTNKISLFSNAGNSFMSPSLKSIGGTVPLSEKFVPGQNGQLPNQNLKPENGISIDFGGETVFPFEIHTTIRAFNTIITDAIIDNVISDNPSQTMSVNRGRTSARGIEASLEQKTGYISWFANITYTKSEIENPEASDQNGIEVPFVPELMGNLGLTVYSPFDITFSPRIHFGGKIYDSSSKTNRKSYDSKELLNLVISKKIKFHENRELSVFLKLYNLSNNRYTMPWQFRDTGRNISVDVQSVF